MKKALAIIFILALLGGGTYYIYKANLNANLGTYESEKLSSNSIDGNSGANSSTNSSENSSAENSNKVSNADVSGQETLDKESIALEAPAQASQESVPAHEEELASFTTKIHNKDSARQNNISITCSTLNGTEVPTGETFSFCNTVGKATFENGYQEADIFVSGEKTKGLGGGNCQVSTTLYNAVLAVPSLTVTERHAHSNYVPYIEKGKDAAVAYGSYDFKFVNNSENTIRIDVQNTESEITVKLIRCA